MNQSTISLTPGLALLIALGCGGKAMDSSTGTQSGHEGTGGGLTMGGSNYAGNGLGGTQPSLGGASNVGVLAGGSHFGTGGIPATGGFAATGGMSVITCTTTPTPTCADNCAVASAASGNFVITGIHNYFQLVNYAGYGYVYISPTAHSAMPTPGHNCTYEAIVPNSTDTLDCGNTAFAPSTSALCGAGTVPADCTYNAVAGIGFNLNQSYTDRSAKPITSPATISTVTVTFVNTANSNIRIQIVQHTAGGAVDYCYDITGMTSPLTVDAGYFTTTCWDGRNPGSAWNGTGAESFEFIIPSQELTPTSFDACIQNVVFH